MIQKVPKTLPGYSTEEKGREEGEEDEGSEEKKVRNEIMKVSEDDCGRKFKKKR